MLTPPVTPESKITVNCDPTPNPEVRVLFPELEYNMVLPNSLTSIVEGLAYVHTTYGGDEICSCFNYETCGAVNRSD